MTTLFAGALALAVLLSGRASAQGVDSTAGAPQSAAPATGAPARILSLWTAGARDQALYTRLGWRHDRGLFMYGVERGWLLRGNASGSRTLYYLAGVLPYATSTGMPSYTTRTVTTCSSRVCETTEVTSLQPHTVHAFGVMPVGFASSFRMTSRVAVRGRATAGALYFGEPIPDPAARRANFTFDLGGTLDVRVTERLSVTGGMRVNHISNGYTARVNPGMNSFLPELGIVLGK